MRLHSYCSSLCARCVCSLTNVSFENNRAYLRGGGMYALIRPSGQWQQHGKIDMHNCSFIENKAYGGESGAMGGGVYLSMVR